MPRYFLNLRHRGELVQDVEGADYTNLEAARTDAILSAREIMANRVMRGKRAEGGRFEIVDDKGEVVLAVPFEDATAA